MDLTLYTILQEVASAGATITYSELAEKANRASAALGSEKRYYPNFMTRPLNEINQSEHDRGRPLLSAVVINDKLQRPGAGFFELPWELELYSGNDEEEFWRDQLQRVHTCWKQHSRTTDAG